MAKIPELIESLDIIQQLGDNPGVDNDLSPQELKAEFDKAANIIKHYLNNTMLPTVNGFVASSDGLLPVTGGTMEGPLNMGNHEITNVQEPKNPGDAASKKYTDDQNAVYLEKGKAYANNLIVSYENVKVPVEAWSETPDAPNYPWAATIPLDNVKANMIPSVTLSLTDSLSGLFAPVSETYEGGVYIFAEEKPEAVVTIPTIILWRAIK